MPLLAVVAALLFVAAAVRDLGWRLIDNRLVAAALVAWFGHAVLSGWGGAAIFFHLAIGVAAFAVALGAGLAGWMGGGDVKLAAAVFTWAGPEHALAILVMVVVAGLLLAVLGVAADAVLRRWPSGFARRGLFLLSAARGVPYGVALACGGGLAALAAG
ncbi:prepilin peptidase [Magnetospirillum aberrantis]|uniref:Peptidase A24 n=1 Tax=Magnetospirillum aberrantis SpK TaxID=908842 RepID=A0A7C9QUW0_9PROT|nr:prepilin peptidase [Magnetospirillum aberrantis]NFV80741.1 peptidase A24 [Magnetospirillum aberrantis SpK]